MPINLTFFLNGGVSLFDTESLVRYGGLLIVFLVVFGSTGIFFCFFLPSGGVLFAAGLLTATGGLHYNIFIICSLLILASILGNLAGYWFGWVTGPLLYKRKDSRFFHQKNLKTASAFYDKYGWLALAGGLFLPIVRTFSPIVAGIVRVGFRRFITFISVGSVLWVLIFVLAGYFIGTRPELKSWIKYIVIGFVLLVTVPLIIKTIRELRKIRKETSDEA